jgi:hypothetical protein
VVPRFFPPIQERDACSRSTFGPVEPALDPEFEESVEPPEEEEDEEAVPPLVDDSPLPGACTVGAEPVGALVCTGAATTGAAGTGTDVDTVGTGTGRDVDTVGNGRGTDVETVGTGMGSGPAKACPPRSPSPANAISDAARLTSLTTAIGQNWVRSGSRFRGRENPRNGKCGQVGLLRGAGCRA